MEMAKELVANLTLCLKELHLPTVREGYREQAEMARRESLCYEHYLLELIEREREVRRVNRIAPLLRESKLPLEKSIESFDRSRLPGKVDALVGVLLEGAFLANAENVLAFGNPGSGKSTCSAPLARNWFAADGGCCLLCATFWCRTFWSPSVT